MGDVFEQTNYSIASRCLVTGKAGKRNWGNVKNLPDHDELNNNNFGRRSGSRTVQLNYL